MKDAKQAHIKKCIEALSDPNITGFYFTTITADNQRSSGYYFENNTSAIELIESDNATFADMVAEFGLDNG